MNEKLEEFRKLLNRAANEEQFAEMERGGKAVSALVKAEQDLAEFKTFVEANAASTDEDAVRAELRSRLAAYLGSDD